MSDLQAQSLDATAQTTEFAKGKAERVTVAGSTIGRFTYHPGWRWSESVKPLVNTESCQMHHVGYALEGHVRVRSDDGTEQDIRAGDAYNIPPGHDGWVVGDETYRSVEFLPPAAG